jgi:3-deoxy-manno-octulosonate cytidylyltransferase (CMP-KDO synthetase)
VQGDLPVLDPETIRAPFRLLADPSVDIATPVALAADDERDNPNVVKAVFEPIAVNGTARRSISRACRRPAAADRSITISALYAYRRAALKAFVAAPQSVLEKREKLEQLRALSLGLSVHVAVVDTVPLGVDTQADLDRARALLEQ